MKSFKFILTAAFIFIGSSLFAQKTILQTDTIKVYGECGMCKNRIQKALKLDGIATANWNTETKLLTVNYNPDIISNNEIQRKVAAVGHDTEKYQADDEVYEKLRGCCLYERKKDGVKQ